PSLNPTVLIVPSSKTDLDIHSYICSDLCGMILSKLNSRAVLDLQAGNHSGPDLARGPAAADHRDGPPSRGRPGGTALGHCRVRNQIQSTSRPITPMMPTSPQPLIPRARFRFRVARSACGFLASYSCPQSLQITALHRIVPTVPKYHG